MHMDTEPEDQMQPTASGTDPALDEAMKSIDKDPSKILDGMSESKKEEPKH